MARIGQLFYVLGFILSLAMCSNADQFWCIARISAPDDTLQEFLDYACGQLDCSGINPGGVCYEPNTLRNHASYALDLYYRIHGVCSPEIGIPVVTDPSCGPCHYP